MSSSDSVELQATSSQPLALDETDDQPFSSSFDPVVPPRPRPTSQTPSSTSSSSFTPFCIRSFLVSVLALLLAFLFFLFDAVSALQYLVRESFFIFTRRNWLPSVMMLARSSPSSVFIFVTTSFLASLSMCLLMCLRCREIEKRDKKKSNTSREAAGKCCLYTFVGMNRVSVLLVVVYLCAVALMCGFVALGGENDSYEMVLEALFFVTMCSLTLYFVCFTVLGLALKMEPFADCRGFCCCCPPRKKKVRPLSLNEDVEEEEEEEEEQEAKKEEERKKGWKFRCARCCTRPCCVSCCWNCVSGCKITMVSILVFCFFVIIIPFGIFGQQGLPKDPIAVGGGSGHVICPDVITSLESIHDRLGTKRVLYASTKPWSNAQKIAAKADIALVFVGVGGCEGFDRETLSLGKVQDGLIEAVTEVQPNTAVVVNCPGAVLMPWISKPRAVLVMWLPGKQDGPAVTSVLFGDSNPHGRLPLTFPKSDTQIPLQTKSQYPGFDGAVHYSEGLFIGYRWYDQEGEKPLFPFGHGLSYSSFTYSHLTIEGSIQTRAGSPVVVSFFVTNSASVRGKEVYQIYLGFPASAKKPPKVLANFGIVDLDAGEGKAVRVDIQWGKLLSTWNEAKGSWTIANGEFQLFVGSSSRDIRLAGSFIVDVPAEEAQFDVWQKPNLEARGRASSVVNSMSLNDQLTLVRGDVGWYMGNVKGLPELGIPDLHLEDGPQGVADGVLKATCWPSALSVAATWDPALMGDFARAMAMEQREKGTHILLGPMVNLARVPTGGRNFESFGEDPYLAEEMAKVSILAIQKEGVVATVKHYVDNNQEFQRMSTDAIIDERTQHELYLRPFEAAVQIGVGSVMCSYNRINSIHGCENEALLQDYLKDQMNFQGFVMSDWFATHSTADSVNAGLDMEMPLGFWLSGSRMSGAIKGDKLSKERVRDMALRIMTTLYSVGAIDTPRTGTTSTDTRSKERDELAKKIATASAVLLKNDGFLPLDIKEDSIVAVIGDPATQTSPASMNTYVGVQYVWSMALIFLMLSMCLGRCLVCSCQKSIVFVED